MSGWPIVPLGDLLNSIEAGISPKAEDRPAGPGELGVLKLSALSWGNFKPEENKALPPGTRVKTPRVCAGDLLIARANTTELVGAVVRADRDYPCLLLSDKTLRIVPDPKRVDSGFLLYALRSPRARGHIETHATGTSFSMRNISQEKLAATPITLPPLAEQRYIAAILDRADALRARRRTALAQLDTFAQAILTEMFGDSEINHRQWPVATLGKISDVQGGLQLSGRRANAGTEIPYLRVANVYRNRLDLREIKTMRATESEARRTKLLRDDLLIVEGHGNPDEIGRAALWDGSIDKCIHQNHLIRVRFDQHRVVPVFASHYLNSPAGRRPLIRSGKTTSGLNTISVSQVKATPLPLPPIELQRVFARRLESADRLRFTQKAAAQQLDALFASLQHRAFRGEL